MGSPRFLGGPLLARHTLRPRRDLDASPYRHLGAAAAHIDDVGSLMSYASRGSIAWLALSLSTLRGMGCPTAARKTRFRLVAGLCRAGLSPAGSALKGFGDGYVIRPPFPGLPWRNDVRVLHRGPPPLRGGGLPAHRGGPGLARASRCSSTCWRTAGFTCPASASWHRTSPSRIAPALLARAAHRTKRQIEELLAECAPRPDAPTLVRRLPARPPSVAPGPGPSTQEREPLPLAGTAGCALRPDAVAPSLPARCGRRCRRRRTRLPSPSGPGASSPWRRPATGSSSPPPPGSATSWSGCRSSCARRCRTATSPRSSRRRSRKRWNGWKRSASPAWPPRGSGSRRPAWPPRHARSRRP